MVDFYLYHVERVFDLIVDSPNGNVAQQVIKNMVIDAFKSQWLLAGDSVEPYFTAILERLQSDNRFCKTKKGFCLVIKNIIDDFVPNQVEEIFDRITKVNNGHVAHEEIKIMVTEALIILRLPASKFEKQFLTAILKTLQSDCRFRMNKKGLYLAIEESAHIPHWICMCKRRFDTTEVFQKHLNESNHFDGRITKNVSNQCYMKLSKTGVAKTAVSTYPPSHGQQTAASISPPNHGMQCLSTNNLTVTAQDFSHSLTGLNYLLSDDQIESSGIQDEIGGAGDELSVPSIDAGRQNENENEDDGGNDTCRIDSASKGRLIRYFCSSPSVEVSRRGNVLADYPRAQSFVECALVGQLVGMSKLDDENQAQEQHQHQQVYLNTHEPFCLVTVGVQGSGKSHTLATVLEGCLIPFPEKSVCRLDKPMTTLVLHYDESVTSRCEATGLGTPSPHVLEMLNREAAGCSVPEERMTILVSPTYYKQRKSFYEGFNCTVKPLLFEWKSLTANHIKCIMGIKDTDSQLYVSTMLELLKRYQRNNMIPDVHIFFKEVKSSCKVSGQAGPLDQRIALLESMIAESTINKGLDGCDLHTACLPGHLVVADLTDPLLSKVDVNGIFQVLVEQYRSSPAMPGHGKVLALDEAHKYMDGAVTDGLSAAIVNIARLMRHDGIRLIVGTQSPLALAPELLELVTVAIIHRFHSKDWFTYLKVKIPLDDTAFDQLLDLEPGEALIFTSAHQIGRRERDQDKHVEKAEKHNCHYGRNVFKLKIRPRITVDIGGSVVNKTKSNLKKKVDGKPLK